MQKHKLDPLWQDRDIRFDASHQELCLRNGEKLIECWPEVEDTKGNTGEIGRLTLSNLRIIWQSIGKPRINLSIGLNCITSITQRMIHTKLRGRNESLSMMSKVNGTRYEFIFIPIEQASTLQSSPLAKEMVDMVSKVCRAYVQSKLYRDLRLRSAIISSAEQKQLKMLPMEQIYSVINGVWNLSSDQGNLGTMYLTNVRVVWHANINELFNISLPYIQIRNIKVRDSKFGLALVIESSESSGGYVLGFRVDPVDRLNSVYEELNQLYAVHSTNPEFGVLLAFNLLISNNKLTFNEQDQSDLMMLANSCSTTANHSMGAYQEMLDTTGGGEESSDAGANNRYDPVLAYLAEGELSSDQQRAHQWTYDASIGLSVESIKEGFTIDSLWEVVESGK